MSATAPPLGDPEAGPVRRVMQLSRPVSWRLLLAAFLGALAIGSSVGLIATSAWLISRASQQPPILYLSIAVVGVRAFGVGRSVFRYAERLVSHDAAFRTLTDMRVAIYSRLADNGPVALRPYRRGDLLSRLVSDVDSVQDLSLRVLVPGLSGALVALGSVVLAGWLLPAAGAVLLAALLVGGVLVPWLTLRAGERAVARLAPVRGRLSAEVVDLFAGAADVAASGATGRLVAQVSATDAEFTADQRADARAAGLAAALGAAAQGLAVIGAILVAVPAVRAGTLDGVNLAVVVLLPLAAYESVVTLPNAALALLRVRTSAERVFEVTDAPPAVHEAADPLPLPGGVGAGHGVAAADGESPRADRAGAGTRGAAYAVEVRGLSARYPGADADAVAGVDFDLAPGRMVALMGPSGSGKSTVANVLERFLDYGGSVRLRAVGAGSAASGDGAGDQPVTGRVAAEAGGTAAGDGGAPHTSASGPQGPAAQLLAPAVELRDLDSDDVRTIIGECGQDAHVFDTTIGENVRLARREATDADVLAALDAARLGEWVRSQPRGLDTAVGSHGAALSGGQRQRLALARVIIADFDVVVLDEPTEHLDPETATALMADLRAATADKAVLLITHHPADAAGADETVLLTEAGR